MGQARGGAGGSSAGAFKALADKNVAMWVKVEREAKITLTSEPRN